ncbi:unnamed protein product [Cyclocybe aegerita]|uniref:DUF6699 domain-containing protein n=1 Tax=Cyclocybe aegerita TaxID=1973307 RepID=A0A8S0VS05_CYCAE|nr:unnamed protein product [Cyclocybe aegerita]
MFRSKRSQSVDGPPPSSGRGFFSKVARVMSFKRSSSQSDPVWFEAYPPPPAPFPAAGPPDRIIGPPITFGQYSSYGQGPQYHPPGGYNAYHPPRQTDFIPPQLAPPVNGPAYGTTPPRPYPTNYRPPPRDHPPNFSGPQPRRPSDASQNMAFNSNYVPAPPPPPPQERQSRPEHRRQQSSSTSRPYNPQRGPYTNAYDQTSHSARPVNRHSSSSNRVDAAPQARQAKPPHVPYFIDPDAPRPRRDSDLSSRSREHAEQPSSSQRRRSNPYASTPRNSNSSLPRPEETTIAAPQPQIAKRRVQPYELAQEVKITSKVEYPSILYHFWNPPSDAQYWKDSRTVSDVPRARANIAITPPVTKIWIASYKHGDALSIALTRWGDIEIGHNLKPKPITVRDILLGIWDYFQRPLAPDDWAEFLEDSSLFVSIHQCYAYRRQNTQAQMPENAMDAATRADTLWGYWVFRGLELDDDFETTRKVYLKVSHYLAQDWNN